MPTLVIIRDVWINIMSYLTISLTEDPRGEIKAKRMCLLSLALTASGLTDIALAELWKSMESLQPIVHVLDYVSTGPGERESYRTTNYSPYSQTWLIDFRSSARRETVMNRVAAYLSRIRRFNYEGGKVSPIEFSLWHNLYLFLWPSPLLPQLTHLFLNLEFRDGLQVHQAADWVTCLLSPSLRVLTLDHPNRSPLDERFAIPILNIIHQRKIRVTHLVYGGYITSRTMAHILGLFSLQTISIPHWQAEGQMSPAALEASQRNTSLTTLDIQLNAFAEPASFGKWLSKAPSLSDLTLHGSSDKIYLCLQASDPIGTIRSFRLGLQEQGRRPLMKLVNMNFPNMEAFGVEVEKRGVDSQSTAAPLEDVMLLREKTLTSLVIKGFQDFLSSTDDLITIITTWPKLRRLCIQDKGGRYARADEVLVFWSQHATSLRDATASISLASLVELPLTHSASRCPLERLGISAIGTHSYTTSDLVRIAANLVLLFPRITTVEAVHSGRNNNILELSNILGLLQQFVLSLRKTSGALLH